jgi:hypothetical protein
MEMAEHDLMREQRYPFVRRRPVARVSPNQFMLAIAVPNQPGLAKPAD